MAAQPINPTKVCAKCGEEKPLDKAHFFQRGPRWGRGAVWESPCLACRSIMRSNYYFRTEKQRRGVKPLICRSCGNSSRRENSKQKHCRSCQKVRREIYMLEAGRGRRARERQAEGRYTLAEFHGLCAKLGWRCTYCNAQVSKDEITADHKTPLTKGGTNWIDNITPACRSCNSRKNNRTVEEFMEFLAARRQHAGSRPQGSFERLR